MFEEARQLFIRGNTQYEAGEFAQALASFEASLLCMPGRVSTLGNLGATLIKLGQPDAALSRLDQALAVEPTYVDAWLHRGLALAELDRHSEALACHDRVLELSPSNVPACYQRCLMLNKLGRYEEALGACNLLLVLQPDSIDGLWARGEILHRLLRHEDAVVAYTRLLSLNPHLDRAWSQKGGILNDLGRTDEAAAAFRQALDNGGDPALNGYFLASLTGQHTPVTAPKGYVQALFDDYADQFDEHLVGVLGYRAHIVLMENAHGLGKPHFQSALDLGCGTGLCGPLVKQMADRVEGVDLSASMIARAQALNVYDSLAQADLSEHLQTTGQRHDLVLSADVFIYVGALDAVFAGVQRVLEPGGLFCFSVECTHDAVDYRLMPSQRYAHSERYLRSLAAQNGFAVVKMLEHPVREEQRKAIDGLFVYLIKI